MNMLAYIALSSALLISVTAKAEGVGEIFTSFAGFQLGAVKLANIQNQLGTAKVVETGDAGEYTASVCYAVPNGVVLFFAGELDGPEHNLGGFGFAKKTERKPCGNWPATLTAPALDIGGLRLGLTMKEFTNIVGTSVHLEGNKAYALFEGRRTMTEEETSRLPKEVQVMVKTGEQQNYFDVVVSVVATFSRGLLVELRVWKTETT
jgi:hypothetical protein